MINDLLPLPQPPSTGHRTLCVPLEKLSLPHDALHPPVRALYARGNISLLARHCLAIVGSRRASAQGLEDARWFATEAARAGLTVVSGLAVGIDAAAHRGALAIDGGTTIAVLAHGLDQVYPPRHRGLVAQILDQEGLILSEYPDGVTARPFQFVHRNRIIAGISHAVCVIEAGPGSGSLITALNAMELGRDVFAVPGSVHLPLSAGGHQLIRQGAGLVTRPEELLFDMGITSRMPSTPTHQHKTPTSGSDDARVGPVLTVLDWAGQSAAALAMRLQWSLQDTLVGLLLAENLGHARRLADGDWVRFQDHR